MKFITSSPEETEAVGKATAERLLAQGISTAFLAMQGEMGVGKTAFTRGFASALGIRSVKSPTYTVVNEYRGGTHPVFHFDMYRIDGADDLYSIGFYDYLERDGYAICEWSENIREELPRDAVTVTIRRCEEDENIREIQIEGSIFA